MEIYQITAIIINLINFAIWVGFPLYTRIRLWKMLYIHRNDIKFKLRKKWLIKNSSASRDFDLLDSYRYVQCRIDINPTNYIVWAIWEDGTLVKFLDPNGGKKRWQRESVIQFTKMSTTIALNSLILRYPANDYLICTVKKTWSIDIITRRILNTITAEPYVMAKIEGIEEVDH